MAGLLRTVTITIALAAAAATMWTNATKRYRLSRRTSATPTMVLASAAREYVTYVVNAAAGTSPSATARRIRDHSCADQASPIAIDIDPHAPTAFQYPNGYERRLLPVRCSSGFDGNEFGYSQLNAAMAQTTSAPNASPIAAVRQVARPS